jgi:hypothetical protein
MICRTCRTFKKQTATRKAFIHAVVALVALVALKNSITRKTSRCLLLKKWLLSPEKQA